MPAIRTSPSRSDAGSRWPSTGSSPPAGTCRATPPRIPSCARSRSAGPWARRPAWPPPPESIAGRDRPSLRLEDHTGGGGAARLALPLGHLEGLVDVLEREAVG